MEIKEVALCGPVAEELIALSADWEAENNCRGYRKNGCGNLEGNRIFVAEESGEIIGYLFGKLEKSKSQGAVVPDGTDYFEVEELYVKPSYRSQGVGSALWRSRSGRRQSISCWVQPRRTIGQFCIFTLTSWAWNSGAPDFSRSCKQGEHMVKAISLLGSTGSIGRQTLDVCREQGIKVAALTARTSIDLLERQAREFCPRLVAVNDLEPALELARRLAGLDIEVAYGLDGLRRAASLSESDAVVTAVVGMAALLPTMAAIEAGKRVAFANKETLVCAGELVMETAKRYGAEIIPVDSEHSAIFQCLQGSRDRGEIKRLILTCSGGPFFGLSREEVARKTKADALRHPNWTMGEKITIDCATLMNKGLEFIEAMRLFRVTPDQVDVVIHRQSIIHSMVEFRDGAVLAQMGMPDMRLPIRYALTYPYREKSELPALDLLKCPPLTFAPPDLEAFPCLKMAMDCARTGGTSCAVLNGANEAAVELFRQERISFGQIPDLVAKALGKIPSISHPSMEEILEADQKARTCVLESAA